MPGPIMMIGVSAFGQAEFLVRLNVDRQSIARRGAIGEQGGTHSAALAIVRAIANDGDRGVDFSGVRRRA